eukprot:5156229-Prymnesium_polylepis.2
MLRLALFGALGRHRPLARHERAWQPLPALAVVLLQKAVRRVDRKLCAGVKRKVPGRVGGAQKVPACGAACEGEGEGESEGEGEGE